MKARLLPALVLFLGSGFIGRAASVLSDRVPNQFDLRQALTFALDNNFAIRRARERIREQAGVVTSVSAAALPSVSASGSLQKSDFQLVQFPSAQNPGTPLIIPSGRYWRMNLTVRQTLYAGGGIQSAIGSAVLTREAAIFDLKAVINDALLEVRIRFYMVLLARENIKVQEQNIDLLKSQLHDATIRFEEGTISEFELLRAEVALGNAKPPLIKARNDYRQAVQEMRQVIGLMPEREDYPDRTLEVIGTLTFERVEIKLSDALFAANSNRPELQGLTKLLRAAESGELKARAAYYPSFALTAGGELRTGPTEDIRDSLRGLRAGAQIQWNGNFRATTGRVKQADSLIEQSNLALSAMELAVQIEVRRALSSLKEASELVNATQQSVKQAEEAVKIALVSFKVGMSKQLDLLQSQVALTVARTNQIRAYYGHSVALARLRKAMGLSDLEYVEIVPGKIYPK